MSIFRLNKLLRVIFVILLSSLSFAADAGVKQIHCGQIEQKYLYYCIVEDATHFVHVDPQRVYLFGNSMGGYLAFDGAMFESEYFAAIAVHANRIDEQYSGIVKKALRKTPIAIYIGDHDQFFSVDNVRKTRDLLRKEGFPVHYVELINHDHNYYALSNEINADAWKFLKEQSLPAAPPCQ